MMKYVTLVLCGLTALACSTSHADVISADYTINYDADSATDLTGVTQLGSTTIGTGAEADFSFLFSSGMLDLTIDGGVAAMGVPIGTTAIWTFSDLMFAPSTALGTITQIGTGPPIVGVTGVTANSFTIETSGAGVFDGSGELNYQFDLGFAPTAAVPEPSSVAMLCALGLGGVWVRRRRQASAA